jgi:hypothetical protein
VIRTIDCDEDDVVMTLVHSEVDGTRLIVAHPDISALEQVMQWIVDNGM